MVWKLNGYERRVVSIEKFKFQKRIHNLKCKTAKCKSFFASNRINKSTKNKLTIIKFRSLVFKENSKPNIQHSK